MATFTIDGEPYEYLSQDPGRPEETQSWEYAKYPKVIAMLPLATGSVDVYAMAQRWTPSHILVSRQDDGDHSH